MIGLIIGSIILGIFLGIIGVVVVVDISTTQANKKEERKEKLRTEISEMIDEKYDTIYANLERRIYAGFNERLHNVSMEIYAINNKLNKQMNLKTENIDDIMIEQKKKVKK